MKDTDKFQLPPSDGVSLGRRRSVRLLGRTVLGAAVASVAGCGSGGELENSGSSGLLPTGGGQSGGTTSGGTTSGGIRQGPLPLEPPGRYRSVHPFLFQPIPGKSSPSRLAGGTEYSWRIHGANANYIDRSTGWAWSRPDGDWLDANEVANGPLEWFRFDANLVSGSTATAIYVVDITEFLNAVWRLNCWNALLLRGEGAPRTIAAIHQDQHIKPVIDVNYQDGSTGVLECTYVADMLQTGFSSGGEVKSILPVVLEFFRPTKAITSARLTLTIVEHWDGPASIVKGFIVNPPLNLSPIKNDGIASAYQPLDAGIISDTVSVIGAHRYLDGTQITDFTHSFSGAISSESSFDPSIYGRGPADTTKLPHAGLGKWINAPADRFSVVSSSYSGEGFVPLAPGLGALKVTMPAEQGVVDGSVVGSSGTVAANAKIFLPEPDFGRLKRIFVRYYFRLHAPYQTPFDKRYQVRHQPDSNPVWTDYGGKIGIMPAHDTRYGGVSGSSGGGYGWQMRLSWSDCDTGMNGPNDNSLALGLHTFDFQGNNPPGHNYAGEDPLLRQFGQIGGLGGIIYPNNWYCIETEVDLNSVTSTGFVPDGVVRVWLDGRLAFERTGMVMRSLPLIDRPYEPSIIRPVRELGHRDLWFNWFHGGLTKNTIDRTIFITGLVWARNYIGPMRFAA